MFDWSKYAVGGAKRPDSFTGLNPDFSTALSQMLLAAEADLGPNALSITSAYRSPEKQAELYEAALKKYGSPAAARKWVAPPGRSMHNKGLAVDFGAAGGGLLRDPNSREAQWLKANATKFGLDVPMSWEPWQVELAGAREGKKIAAETMSLLGKGPQTSTKGPQMMQEQKPQGLLGSLGIQKMEEGAEGETGQRFYNRDSFKDTAAVLAQGFGRMGIMGMEEIADSVAKQRTEVKAKNKTMEALMKMGTPQAQAAVEYINAGGDPVSALKMAFERPKAQAGVAVGDRLVNPVTGEVIYEDASAPKFDPKDVVTARKEFSSLPPVKQFSDQTSAYGRVVASVDDPSPSGDLALIFNFMKVLDPGSVVREGEFATAQNAGGIDQRTRGLYNRITSGERLTPEQRADFADRATRLYSEAQGQYQSLAEQYAGFAEQAGLPVDQVIPDFSYSKGLYRKPLEFSRPPPPTMPDGTRVSPEEWATAWSNMTEAQRQEFIDGGAN
jgi:hypothetical protein